MSLTSTFLPPPHTHSLKINKNTFQKVLYPILNLLLVTNILIPSTIQATIKKTAMGGCGAGFLQRFRGQHSLQAGGMGGSKGQGEFKQGEFKQLHPGLTFIGVLGGSQQSSGLGRDRKKGSKSRKPTGRCR